MELYRHNFLLPVMKAKHPVHYENNNSIMKFSKPNYTNTELSKILKPFGALIMIKFYKTFTQL